MHELLTTQVIERGEPTAPAGPTQPRFDIGSGVLALSGVLVVSASAWEWFRAGGAEQVTLVADLLDVVLGFVLAGLTWRTARVPALAPGVRRGWRLIALGFTAYWLGNVLWFRDEVLRGVSPFPSLADLGYLSFPPLVLAGLLCFTRPFERRAERVQFWFDVGVVAIGTGTLVWFFVLQPIAGLARSGTLELVLNQTYPLGDTVLLVGVAALLMKRRSQPWDWPLAWLIAGLLALFFADTRFAYQQAVGTYAPGGATDGLYNLAYLLLMVGPFLAHRRATRVPAAPGPVASGRGLVLLPYVAIAAVYGLLLLVAFGAPGWPALPPAAAGYAAAWAGGLRGLIGAAAVLTITVLARQAVAAREIARLRAEQATRATEARFAALVRHSSDVIGVLAPDLRLRFVSPAVERVLGLKPEALTHRPLLDLLHPEDRQRVAGFLAGVLADGREAAATEWRLRHADGGWRDIETLATNLTADAAVGGVVLNSRDVTERRRLEQRLRVLAFQDPLTGLANRTLFRDRLEHALARAARTRRVVTLMYLDLDDFKTINDSLGHAAGDALLRTLAERLRQCARASDTVARLGGDELALLIEDPLPPEDLAALARRIAARLGEPIALCGRDVRATASIGIAQGGAADGAEALMGNADLAMYSVKGRGKQGFALFEPAMYRAVLERMDLESDLRRALERGELRLHYQPIIQLRTGTLAGAEALVRWQHPRRGLLLPGVFIPVAEEKGELVVALGRWVLQEACRQGKRWLDQLPAGTPWTMAVNTSVRQFQHSDLVLDVERALAASGLDPRALVLEITESSLMQSTEDGLRQLTALKAHGVRLAIDDFGIGYSSLAYLHRYPFDILKLDRSFVAALADGSEAAPLTRAIVAIAAMLNLETVAEGLEEPVQVTELCRLGCPYGQGLFFAPALDAAAFSEQWLSGRRTEPWQRVQDLS